MYHGTIVNDLWKCDQTNTHICTWLSRHIHYVCRFVERTWLSLTSFVNIFDFCENNNGSWNLLKTFNAYCMIWQSNLFCIESDLFCKVCSIYSCWQVKVKFVKSYDLSCMLIYFPRLSHGGFWKVKQHASSCGEGSLHWKVILCHNHHM